MFWQKQSTNLPDDFMQLLYDTNPEPVAQMMKYKVSHALHAVTSYYTCMKLPYVLIPLQFTCIMYVGLWNKFCYPVPVDYFAIGNLCSLG